MTTAEFKDSYVGTIVGESTSREFRLAVAREAIREQDIIAVDAVLNRPGSEDGPEEIRVWAKVQRIERLNPLFPSEAGHELAETRTDPFDTVLSLSREMVTAVCQVIGSEPLGVEKQKLDQLRYPPQPASSAYRPASNDIKRIVLGELDENSSRALDIAQLSNRPDVDVNVNGHAIVTRHLAILAMTGAGKSVTARRIIEELAKKNYPIVIFDPHGEYTGLAEVPGLKDRVKRYYAYFPVFDEDSETISRIVSTLGYELTPTMQTLFSEVFDAARSFFVPDDEKEMINRVSWLSQRLSKPNIAKYSVRQDMWLVAYIAEAGELALREGNQQDIQQLQTWGWQTITNYSPKDRSTLEGIKKRTYKSAAALYRMEETNRRVAGETEPLPTDRTKLVEYGIVSVVSLAGYTDEFRATLYSIIASEIFEARIRNELTLPALMLLEEAHNFAPAKANSSAEQQSTNITKQIAQEGRKFGVGLILISQRPSRLDETTLSQCNSYIIMRMVNPADQNYVRRVVETLGEDEASLLPDLDVGEAILSGQLVNFPVLVKIKSPVSKGEHEEEDAFTVLKRAQEEMNKKKR